MSPCPLDGVHAAYEQWALTACDSVCECADVGCFQVHHSLSFLPAIFSRILVRTETWCSFQLFNAFCLLARWCHVSRIYCTHIVVSGTGFSSYFVVAAAESLNAQLTRHDKHTNDTHTHTQAGLANKYPFCEELVTRRTHATHANFVFTLIQFDSIQKISHRWLALE